MFTSTTLGQGLGRDHANLAWGLGGAFGAIPLPEEKPKYAPGGGLGLPRKILDKRVQVVRPRGIPSEESFGVPAVWPVRLPTKLVRPVGIMEGTAFGRPIIHSGIDEYEAEFLLMLANLL